MEDGQRLSLGERTLLETDTDRRGKKPEVTGAFPQLILAHAPEEGRWGERTGLYGAPVVLGRDPEARGFPGGPLDGGKVSRQHARAVRRGKSNWAVEDLGSTNGTYVNGEKIHEQTELVHGDIVRIGHVIIQFVNEPVPDEGTEPIGFLGVSFQAASLRAQLRRIARTDTSVLLQGESGTGKEVAAQSLHKLSARADGPLIDVNCPAIPASLWESELFGHEKGAFSGATASRAGLVERAHGGTLFLDELGELPMEMQSKLLRVLESGEVLRVGGSKVLKVDFRIVAASNRDLAAEAASKRFRRDLFARIAHSVIELPPLRERKADVPILLSHFVRDKTPGRRSLAGRDMETLMLHPWPLNVRELLSFASILATDQEGTGSGRIVLGPEALQRLKTYAKLDSSDDGSSDSLPNRESGKGKRSPSELDEPKLQSLLAEHHGVVADVAKSQGLHRFQVYRLLKKFGLNADDFR